MALQQHTAVGITEPVLAAFVAWLSQVQLDTLAGIAPCEQAQPAYDHPLALWFSSHLGGLWSVRCPASGQPIAERWQAGQVVETRVLPTWAAAFYDHTLWWAGRKLTSADCLSLLDAR